MVSQDPLVGYVLTVRSCLCYCSEIAAYTLNCKYWGQQSELYAGVHEDKFVTSALKQPLIKACFPESVCVSMSHTLSNEVLNNTFQKGLFKIITITISWESLIRMNVGLECGSVGEHVPNL